MTSTQTPIWASMEPQYRTLLTEMEIVVLRMDKVLAEGIDWLKEIGAPWPPSE